MRYQRFVYVQDATEAVAGEVLGAGDGVKVTFSGSLAQDNIQPGTLTITAGAQTLTDDGAGKLTGDGSGTIDYDTGDYSATFNVAPASGVSVTADYDYHPTVDFTTSLPGMQWIPSAPAVGGIEFAASGMPASWEQRADYLLHQRLRMTEAEYAAVEALLEHARRGTPITVYPDATGTGRVCYAEEEWAKSLWKPGIKPQPADFPGTLEIDTVWRSTTGTWAGIGFYG